MPKTKDRGTIEARIGLLKLMVRTGAERGS